MSERVNRRDALKEVLSGGVEMLTRILGTDSELNASSSDSNTVLTPDQAGHLLRTRKTSKHNARANFFNHRKQDPVS